MNSTSIFALFLLFLLLSILLLYFASMVISHTIGVPFVPTHKFELKDIFSHVSLSANDLLYDLGCGNGSVLFYCAKISRARCIGVELNPLLYWWCKLQNKFTDRSTKIHFIHADAYGVHLTNATVVYFFLFPEVVAQLKLKLLAECKKDTLVISHGFKIHGWNRKLIFTRNGGLFPTYYYRV